MWRVILAVSTLMVATPALAQVIGPGGTPISPGPSQPNGFTPGGIGPGGTRVSPGPAARGISISRFGPGHVRLAPGPAGTRNPLPRREVDTSTPLGSSGIIAHTVVTRPRHGHAPRRHGHRPRHRGGPTS